jgi:hypothetical protein
VNDGHDTTNTFLGEWVDYFLTPLLANPSFNDNRTLILLTFDENEDYGSQNTVFSVLLGGAVPNSSIGTTDPTFYSHYSSLSTIEYNWDLGNLGRQDVKFVSLLQHVRKAIDSLTLSLIFRPTARPSRTYLLLSTPCSITLTTTGRSPTTPESPSPT